MFSWLKKEGEKSESIENVVEGLKRIYKTKLLPLELHYQFHDFHSPQLEEPDFDAKPMILLVGQYSTGKTTFIKYLLERDFPGIRIGPEPTTDRFIAVMYDEKEGVIPGNALVVDPKKQFRPLSKFGNAFLNRFQCSTVSSPVLKGISIVDTPGILSGEKQRVDRGYDFTGVLEWFAERVDRIILLFDAHKLDISDEFRRSIEALRGHDDKIRIVLNKADMIDHQQLMRVYGALMWSLGKVLQTPEVARVYIGSFWDQPLRYDVNRRLFEDEEQDLFRDMQSLPRNAALRKLNDLIKRARLAKVHAYIVSELRKEMPSMFGKDGKKKELIKNLGQVYDRIQREQQISPGDFPDIKKMQETLANHDFTKFHPLKPKLLEVVDHMLATDIARLMDMIPQEDVNIVSEPLIKVMYDEKEGVIPGNALVVDPKKQFRPLSKFGNAFLNRFQCSTVSSPVLKGISIVDTPGILSGEKQRVDRGYDFTGVLEWFAERVDRIILLFDAHKLDISDEFRRSIEALRGHDDKIRIVLNKADMIDHQQLMRVYGALMWSLGKVLQTPEVARVYIGSFWDQPLRYDVNRRLFEDEEQDLFRDMQSLPRNAALRKLNDLIKRARLAKVHAYIVSELRKEMPSMFGKDGKKKELIKNLGQVYDRIQREQQISPGDFPDIKKMQETLANHDFTKFHPLKPKLLEVVDHMLATDIARLMDMIPQEDVNIVSEPLIKGESLILLTRCY
uniref:Dynamin-type G domain-containing protein n=1 Tax=Heliothis virescens TaxID=7102 RepID=A0A2A4J6B7_HELVI